MIQLHQDFGGCSLIFIRYNPDNYKCKGKLIKGNKNVNREKELINLIRLLSLNEIISPLSVIFMYYDNYIQPVQKQLDYGNFKIPELAIQITQ
jgi:hypothetical protein